MRVPALLSLVLLSAAGALPASRFVQEPATAPRAFIDGTGPGWQAGRDDFVNVNCNPDTWAWEGGLLHRPAGRRDAHARAVHQLRARRPVAAPRSRRATPASSCGRRQRPLEDLKPDAAAAAASRCRCSITATPSSTRSSTRQEGRLVHHQRRRLPGRHSSKMKPFAPTSPDGSAQLPAQEPQQGRRRVEPLLRPRHQRRGAPVGQRRRSLRRQRRRAAHRLSCLESEGSPIDSATSGCASCRDAADRVMI